MTNILLKYLEERHVSKQKEPIEKPPSGPVVTISREYGCPAKPLAKILTENLSRKYQSDKKQSWKVITKEILDQAAKELGMETHKIEYIFKFEKRNVFDDILEAFSSKYYKSDRKIKRTLKEVIHSFGEEGNAIIVGRCGATITRDIDKSLHIRLIAPFDVRVDHVMIRHDISFKEAQKMTVEMDKNRANLRDEFAGKKIDDAEYDIILNTSTFTINQMADIIIHALGKKGLIK